MTLELLYLQGCPGHEQLLPVLRALSAEHGLLLIERRITSTSDAEQARFLGSPSVRVNGVDVETGADERSDFGVKCRLYRCVDGQSGVPPRHWITHALQQASAR